MARNGADGERAVPSWFKAMQIASGERLRLGRQEPIKLSGVKSVQAGELAAIRGDMAWTEAR